MTRTGSMTGAIALALVAASGLSATALPGWTTDASGPAPFAQAMRAPDDTVSDARLLGRSFFSIPWVEAPAATTARDGLGPLFNANTCTSCHEGNGSAEAIDADGQPRRALLFKLARPDAHDARFATDTPESPDHARAIDPHYGSQIAINASSGVAPEARPRLDRHVETYRYPDGARITLERFTPRLEGLAYGPLAPDTRVFTRQPPALAGLGLIEAVPQTEILAWEDPDDRDGDGISGRANRMPDGRIGRFGWKAAEPTLEAQIANAAAVDMGLTNSYHPVELCGRGQSACRDAPHGRPSPQGLLDLPDTRLAAIEAYLAGFKAPEPAGLDPQAARGADLFAEIGCSACHRATLTTADGREIRPMSDYLLHDMGPRLADGVREHLAQPTEFRTAPLWGLGARMRAGHRFLHDARAATPEAAILWHGGEAARSRDSFTSLSAQDRAAILEYLESL